MVAPTITYFFHVSFIIKFWFDGENGRFFEKKLRKKL